MREKIGEIRGESLKAFPSGWSLLRLGDIGVAIIGLTYKPENVVKGDGIIVLRSSNIKGNQIDLSDQVRVAQNIPDQLITRTGDILICTRNGSRNLIGKNALISDGAANLTFGAFMAVFRSKYNKYLFQLFQSGMFRKQIFEHLGATINQITTGSLYSFKFPFPTLAEQDRIVEILSTVDQKVSCIEAQIIQTTLLKKCLMQQLLTKGIGHTKFKSSPLGSIPASWEVRKLKEFLLDYKGGASLRPSDFVEENGFEVIPKKAIGKNGQLELSVQKPTYCKYEFANANSANIVDSEYIITVLRDLVPSGPNIGYMVGYSDEKNYLLAQGVYGFRISNLLDKEFLIHYSNSVSYRKIMNSIMVGSTQVHIRNKDFFNIDIPIPDLNEQKKIALIFTSVDEKMRVLNEEKNQCELLKRGLMQQLLTGKMRVKIDEEVPIS